MERIEKGEWRPYVLDPPLRLLQGGGHHVLGQTQVVTQVVNALVRQEPE